MYTGDNKDVSFNLLFFFFFDVQKCSRLKPYFNSCVILLQSASAV